MKTRHPVVRFSRLLALGSLAVPVAFLSACGDDTSSGGGGSTSVSGSTAVTTNGSSSASHGSSTAASNGSASSSTAAATSSSTGVSPNPVAQITAPADGATFPANTDIPFAGSADDPQDGALAGDSLAWVGDLVRGPIPEGFGISGNASFSTPGAHTLTLTATDSDGNMGTAEVTVNIE